VGVSTGAENPEEIAVPRKTFIGKIYAIKILDKQDELSGN